MTHDRERLRVFFVSATFFGSAERSVLRLFVDDAGAADVVAFGLRLRDFRFCTTDSFCTGTETSAVRLLPPAAWDLAAFVKLAIAISREIANASSGDLPVRPALTPELLLAAATTVESLIVLIFSLALAAMPDRALIIPGSFWISTAAGASRSTTSPSCLELLLMMHLVFAELPAACSASDSSDSVVGCKCTTGCGLRGTLVSLECERDRLLCLPLSAVFDGARVPLLLAIF